jgi:hypothetical protein
MPYANESANVNSFNQKDSGVGDERNWLRPDALVDRNPHRWDYCNGRHCRAFVFMSRGRTLSTPDGGSLPTMQAECNLSRVRLDARAAELQWRACSSVVIVAGG